jgi:hypothetical protein
MGGTEPGPEGAVIKADESTQGPGGRRFNYRNEKNLVPKGKPSSRLSRIAGPGEAGFASTRQKNTMPQREAKDTEKKVQKKPE